MEWNEIEWYKIIHNGMVEEGGIAKSERHYGGGGKGGGGGFGGRGGGRRNKTLFVFRGTKVPFQCDDL